MKKLTNKQKRFIAEYPKDCNGTQAAIRAGYSKHTANEIARKLLTKVDIKKKVEAKLQSVADKCGVTVEFIVLGLKENALLAKGLKDISASNGAYKMLGEHLNIFKIPDQDINIKTFETIKTQLDKYQK